MKYHFIYPDVGTGYYPSVHHGLAQLFAVLRANGQEVSLHHIKREPKQDDILRVVEKERPDYIGFTTMSNQLGYVKKWSQWIKRKYDTPIVCGGVHATLNPREVLEIDGIDAVCIGEGEKAVLDNRFWTKHNGVIMRSEPHPLIENLDDLPYPDYSLFDCNHMLKARNGNFAVIVSRGCPYNCSYCSNHALREVQKGLGKYFRFRSVDNTLSLLGDLISKYPIMSFSFADDIFGIDKEWVFEFCGKYPKRINIPFDCNLRVEAVTKELLEALKSAKCVKVEMGIEVGNEWLRSKVLNRKMTNEQIIDAFENARRMGIQTRAYNMVGLPYETPDMIRETINLNKQVAPDQVALFYFYHYKGTKLYDVCKKDGFLSGRQATGYTSESVLDLPTISMKELRKLYAEFSEYAVEREIQSYPLVFRVMIWMAIWVLGLFAKGREIETIKVIYLKLFPLLQLVRRNYGS